MRNKKEKEKAEQERLRKRLGILVAGVYELPKETPYIKYVLFCKEKPKIALGVHIGTLAYGLIFMTLMTWWSFLGGIFILWFTLGKSMEIWNYIKYLEQKENGTNTKN